MIYQMKLVIRDEERDITDFIYHCHISHYNDPDLDKMIELHIKVCEEIGNREDLPIEGDLIALTFNSTNHDQFFYDWLFEGAMHDGEIQFIYNEVETADIFRFWDCYCLGLEESMSVGGAPMRITIYLSPGIIKRNNLDAREKVWKVSSPSTNPKVTDKSSTEATKKKVAEEPKENSNFVTATDRVEESVNENSLTQKELIKISRDAWKRAQKIAGLLPLSNSSRTICSDGIVTVSGYSEKRVSNKFRKQVGNVVDVPISQVIDEAKLLGHNLHENSFLDNGIVGSSSASHAEKQMLVEQKTEVAIGVSRELCNCCLAFIQKLSTDSKRVIYVTEPPGRTWEFRPGRKNPDLVMSNKI